MSTVAVAITVPGGSPVDYTSSIVFSECNFSQNMNAVAGSFSVKVRDPNRTLSFTTGSEITLTIDGALVFGGYIMSVAMGSFAPAADTLDLSTYNLRTWTLTGVDYNIIFDKRVWRNTANYLTYITLTGDTTDGAALRDLVDNYADLSGFSSSGIQNIATLGATLLVQQGEYLRQKFEDLTLLGGGVWYIDPTKTFIYKPYDDVQKRWGFSDAPNKTPITVSPATYQGATYGFREVEGTEDASYMVNDALIWGGNKFSSGTKFSRTQDATSETDHHRWQAGEAHFNDSNFASQTQVDLRSSLIINGIPGIDVTGQQKGLKYPQWQFTFTWFADDVPKLSGVPDHIIPGDILNIALSVFSVNQLLPLRTLRTSFPDAFVNDGTHKVQFDGTFGLQLSDPFTLWRYLLATQAKAAAIVQIPGNVTPSDTVTTYGTQFSGAPTPATDGATTVFTIAFGYIATSTQVFLNGLIQRRGTDYTESDPIAGQITFSSAPLATDNIEVVCNTLGA